MNSIFLKVWKKRSFELKAVVKLVFAALLGFCAFKLYFFWGYSIEVNLRTQREFNVAVSKAVNRALLLPDQHFKYPVVFFGQSKTPVPFCSLSEALEGGEKSYGTCQVAKAVELERCGTFLFDPGCRTIRVPEELWENNIIKKKIVYATLNVCDFLINVENSSEVLSNGVKADEEINLNYESYSELELSRIWNRAGCEKKQSDSIYQIDTVFVEICQIEETKRLQACNVVNVYKSILRDEKIGGHYVGI